MAMRGRSGRIIPSHPPRLIIGRVYEQFKPMSEWRQEDDHDTLLVYLPGFQKEYIKVTTEDVNTVRVRGERLVAENKWSRFQEDFRVPQNCDMRGIRARFDGGILTITMPMKITTAPPRVVPKAEEQPLIRRTKHEEVLPKPKRVSKEKATALESEKKPERPSSPLKSKTTLPPQAMPPSSSSSRPSKQEPLKNVPEAKEKNEELTFGSLPTSVPKKEKHDVVEKPIEEMDREIHQKGVAGKTDLDEGKGKEIHQNGVAGKTDLDEGKGKEKSVVEEMKRVSEGKMGKSKDAAGVSYGGFVGDKVEEIKRKVVGVGRREVQEDRKLLVNVGVGVLVIVALGVHVCYAMGLIGRGK